MKSLRSLIRQSVLILMAGLLLVFSVLIYAGGDALLRRFVDGRLLGLAETLAKIVEQHPNIIESSGEGSCARCRGEPKRERTAWITGGHPFSYGLLAGWSGGLERSRGGSPASGSR